MFDSKTDTVLHEFKARLDTGMSHLLIALAAQQDLRGSVFKGAHPKGCAASPTQRTLDDATKANVRNLGQVFSGIEQDVLGLEIHVNQLHKHKQNDGQS